MNKFSFLSIVFLVNCLNSYWNAPVIISALYGDCRAQNNHRNIQNGNLLELKRSLATMFPFKNQKEFKEFKNRLNDLFKSSNACERKVYIANIIARRMFSQNQEVKDQLEEILVNLVSNFGINPEEIAEIIQEERHRINQECEVILKLI